MGCPALRPGCKTAPPFLALSYNGIADLPMGYIRRKRDLHLDSVGEIEFWGRKGGEGCFLLLFPVRSLSIRPGAAREWNADEATVCHRQ